MTEALRIDDLARQVKDLPALPQAVMEVMQVLRDDRLSADRCVQLIEQDPALAARTMRLANSAFWGVPGRVSRIGDAVSLLGLRTLSGLLAAAALTQSLPRRWGPEFDATAHWRHSIGVALASRMMASAVGQDPEEAFLAGLMHDIGLLVLASHAGAEHARARAAAVAADLPLHQAELTHLGLHHGQVGALLARHWHFPQAIARAVEDHHAPPDADLSDQARLVGLVHVGDAVAHALALTGRDDEAVPPVDLQAWQAIALTEGRCLAILAQVERGVHEMCAALGIA